MKYRRHWFSTLAAGTALTLALVGCAGGDGEGTESPDPTDPGTTATTDGGETTDPPGESITLEFMHRLPDGEGMVTTAETVARWNEANPDVQVNSTKFDGAAPEMIVRLEADAAAGNAPCIAMTGYGEVPELFVKGLLADVTSEAEKYKANYSEGAYNIMGVGGVMTGLPQDVGPLVYYYDEAQFAELGLEVPTDLDGLIATAEEAAAQGKYVTAFTPDEASYWLSAQAASAGDTWFTAEDDQWVVTATGEGSQRVAELWQMMLDDETTLVTQRWGDGFTQALVNGDLIGHIGAGWEAGFLLDPLDGTDREGTWRVAQLPDFGAGAVTGPDGGSGMSVMAGCDYPAEAVEFIDWLNNQVDDLASQGTLTATTQVVETPEKFLRQFGGQDVMAEMQTASQNLAIDFQYAPGFSTLASMNQVADEVGDGDRPAMDIFGQAQTQAVETLRNMGLPVAE